MLFAIGDIHGQHGKLCELLNIMKPGREDKVIFIGDYIDRGPDSAGVVQTVIELAQATNCVYLRGNHEQMFLEARANFDPSFEGFDPDYDLRSFTNGGAETIVSYTERYGDKDRWYRKIPEEHWTFFMDTVLEHDEGDYRFVHGGYLPPGETWEGAEYGLDPRLWIREPFLSSAHDFGKVIVFGHTPQYSGRPLIMKNKIGIDTAVAYGGPLTAAAIDGLEVEFIQV